VDDPQSLPRDVTKQRRRDIRRCEVRGFSHQVIFEIRGNEVVIVAIAHGSRRPGYWSRRK
jgi:plasmid stabilization system protein ParE